MENTPQPVRSRRNHSYLSMYRLLRIGGAAFICFAFASEALAGSTILSPTALTFYAVQGGSNPPNQTITLSRPLTNGVSLSGTDNATWLTVSPASTTFTTSKKETIAVNSSGLAAGTYKATITFAVAIWYKYYVPVTLIISPATTPPPSTTSSATLTWNAITGTPVSGYKVYVGVAPHLYTQTINVGNVTSSVVKSLIVGRMYYFAVSAYNSAGESAPSNEVSKTIQ